MMRFWTAIAVTTTFLAPSLASAGVMVSEIAWMGTEESPTNEWIELQNTGPTTTDLHGWMLTAKDKTPTITLSGVIAGGAYYLIERTDDTTLPNISADLIASFGSGLSNSGETLTLTDASGTVMDIVKGGKDRKSIGGDAKTHTTPQRQASGWKTGVPTPKAKNIEPVVIPPTPAPTPVASPVPRSTPPPASTIHTPLPTVLSQESSSTPSREELILQRVVFSAKESAPQETSHRNGLLAGGGLILLILLGSLGTLLIHKVKTPEAEEYEIIDVTDEDGLGE